jgi:hypothetical protein
MKIKLLALIGAMAFSASLQAQDSMLEYVAQACKADKAQFCSQVTPGDPRRMLACAYAHEDKLSGECSYALYRAAAAMEQMAVALGYLAESCAGDIETHCGAVREGEGRILACLTENKAKVSASCGKALSETIAN